MTLEDYIIERIITLRNAKIGENKQRILYEINSKLNELECIALKYHFFPQYDK